MTKAHHLLSLIQTVNEQVDEKFKKEFLLKVKDWINNNSESAAQFFLKNKDKIPDEFKGNSTETLYRGFVFDFDDIDSVEDIIKSGFKKTRRGLSSWTESPKVAKDFATGQVDTGKRIEEAFVGLVVKDKVKRKEIMVNFAAVCESTLLKKWEKEVGTLLTNDKNAMGFCSDEREVLVEAKDIKPNKIQDIFLLSGKLSRIKVEDKLGSLKELQDKINEFD